MFTTTLALLTLTTTPALAADDAPATETQAAPVSETDAETQPAPKTKRPLLAAGLNWFLPGAGYLYNGEKPLYVSLPMIAGAVGLTYVEQFHRFEHGTLRQQDPAAFAVMATAVLVLNTGVAIDAFREARGINARAAGSEDRDVAVLPLALAGEEDTAYGLTLHARF